MEPNTPTMPDLGLTLAVTYSRQLGYIQAELTDIIQRYQADTITDTEVRQRLEAILVYIAPPVLGQ